MLSLPTEFAAALASGETGTICYAIEIERDDGTILRLTDAQRAFTADGSTFTPAIGANIGALSRGVNGPAGAMTIKVAAVPGGAIEVADLLAGAYDAAQVRIYLADWATPANGLVALWRGYVDQIEATDRRRAAITVRGMLSRTHFMVTERYSPMCRAMFGDDRCGVDVAALTHTAAVVSVSGYTVVLSVTGTPSRSFALGSIVPTSGRGKGKRFEIRTWSAGTSTAVCFLPADLILEAGDAVQIMPGCPYTVDGCKSYNNILRMRAEPYAFGQDAMAAGFAPIPFADPATSPARPGGLKNHGDLLTLNPTTTTMKLSFNAYSGEDEVTYEVRVDGGDAQPLTLDP